MSTPSIEGSAYRCGSVAAMSSARRAKVGCREVSSPRIRSGQKQIRVDAERKPFNAAVWRSRSSLGADDTCAPAWARTLASTGSQTSASAQWLEQDDHQTIVSVPSGTSAGAETVNGPFRCFRIHGVVCSRRGACLGDVKEFADSDSLTGEMCERLAEDVEVTDCLGDEGRGGVVERRDFVGHAVCERT